MKKLSKLTLILLTFITILSLSIRFYNLGDLPWNMQEDEAMTGYVGRYIIENGMDVYGNKWPLLYFDKFGDYYIIGPIYMKGLSTLVFGMNAFAVRFPTALFGALTVIPIFLLARLLFTSNAVGLLSAFAMAIMPWTIPLGRASSEGILGGFFFLFGLYYLLLALKEKKMKFTVIGALFILFTFWIYHNYRLLSSLFVFGIAVYGWCTVQKKHRKIVWATALVAVLFVVITVAIGRTSWGRGRFDQTGILSPMSGVQIKINELISGDTSSQLVSRLFHNKVLGYGREFLKQYFIYFSGDYLFIRGGKSESYAVPESGLLHISFLVPLLGFIALLANEGWRKKFLKSYLLLLFFIGISPIPSALTVIDSPNIQRSILQGLSISIAIGLGMWSIAQVFKNKHFFQATLIVALFLEFGIYIHHYIVHTDSHTSLYRNDGQRELISYLMQQPDSKKIYLPTYGTMSMYYLFYTSDFSPEHSTKFKHDVKIDTINNVVFMDTECPSEKVNLMPGELVVDPIIACNNNWEGKYSLKEQIVGKNNLIGFRVLETKKIEITDTNL